MSGIVLLVIGLALCFFGVVSIRLGIALAGFGAAWLLADALGASSTWTVVVACAGAAAALICTMLMTHFLFFIGGVCAGAIIGAKAFVLFNGPGSGWLLAVIVVPIAGLIGGFLANHWRRRFLRWATAFAGAALVLSGLGRIGPDFFRNLWRPESALGAIILAVGWIVLTVIGHGVQYQTSRRKNQKAAVKE
ncbi:DUF4203 domain-containing protein [Microlunatus elymi]|uniref:DUF4203 domain-containing protein n=1 Tax=Microlunatus elymi TaxID=2596828 RepID=A0A516Q039_9ACTN|nr:DUF4203 domain-containing protein [Microlunatus elymi]QDP96796.1 DUF4203 domain-containing protein [Microlunatus elymi]